jgi:hypothetical protein
MNWKNANKRQFIANLPSEARTIFTPGPAWLLAGLRTCRHVRSNDRRFYWPIFPVLEKTSGNSGVRSCIPLRGSPGFAPGSLLGAPPGNATSKRATR